MSESSSAVRKLGPKITRARSDANQGQQKIVALIAVRYGAYERTGTYHTTTYHWTVPLILDYLYLVGNLTNSKIAETKALEPLKS
jgi:hypothetical protein